MAPLRSRASTRAGAAASVAPGSATARGTCSGSANQSLDRNGNGGTAPMNATPTLYGWAGGKAAIRRLMDYFYDRVERDELLSPYFPGGVTEEHRTHVSIWWSEVLGGPARYTEDLGGYEKMLAHHRGLAIAPEERHRFVSLISFAADDAGLPDDPEFRSALVAYAEWGSRLAMHNSQPGAEVFEHARAALGLARGTSIPALGRPWRFHIRPRAATRHRACRGARSGRAAKAQVQTAAPPRTQQSPTT